MDKIFLDIETYQNPNLPKAYLDWKLDELVNKTYTDPKKIAKDKEEKMKKFALDARTGMIIMVGTILYNEAKQTYESNYWYNKSGTEKEEKKILLDSMTFITEAIAGGARLVTFNGKTFDIPY